MQAISVKTLKKVAVLGTGGTIAGTAQGADEALSYTSAQLGVETLLKAVPGLSGLPVELMSQQVAQLDSKDMDFDVLYTLACRVLHFLQLDDVAAVVITHGTDTLEETAYFLHAVLPPALLLVKPVVLACAMRPATSKEADGPQNLLDAVTLGIEPGICGVLAVCAGQIHAAFNVQKVHPYRLDAFDSGDAEPLGKIHRGTITLQPSLRVAGEGGLPQPASAGAELTGLELIDGARPPVWPRVEILMSYAGANGLFVDKLVSEIAAGDPLAVQGIVVAGTGNGTVHHALEAALVRAQQAGVRVWRSTRCAYGSVQGVPGLALPDFTPLPPLKARIALMLELLRQQQRNPINGPKPQMPAA